MYHTTNHTQMAKSNFNNNRNNKIDLSKCPKTTTTNYDEDEEFYVIGDRVWVENHRLGSVAYFGETDFGPGDWVGVVLDEPSGNHDGKYHGREYFQCAEKHGLFVRPHRVRRLPDDSALGSSATSSRVATPLPHFSGRSTASSYFYDDDYRQHLGPSVETLERKLKSIEQKNKRSTVQPRVQGTIKSMTTRDTDYIGSRVSELSRRLDDARAPSTKPNLPKARAQESVFNFRPKRERYYEPEEDRGALRTRAVSLSPSREPPRKGERVRVRLNDSNEAQLTGVLRFMGETEFATGEWAGVELDEPVGKNDGSVLGQRYFYCPKNYGLFVPATRVRKLTGNYDHDEDVAIQTLVDQFDNRLKNFGTTRSTVKSPPPPKVTTSTRDGRLHYSSAESRSTTPSYEMTSSPSTAYSSPSLAGSPPLIPNSAYRPSSAASSSIRAETPMSSSGSLASPYVERYKKESYESEDRLAPLRSSSLYADVRLAQFDDRDIEFELKKSLGKLPSSTHSYARSQPTKPKAVQYTFTSSKYDGNPIARRTLLYD